MQDGGKEAESRGFVVEDVRYCVLDDAGALRYLYRPLPLLERNRDSVTGA